MPALRKLTPQEVMIVIAEKHVNQHSMTHAEYVQCKVTNTARYSAQMDGTHIKNKNRSVL